MLFKKILYIVPVACFKAKCSISKGFAAGTWGLPGLSQSTNRQLKTLLHNSTHYITLTPNTISMSSLD